VIQASVRQSSVHDGVCKASHAGVVVARCSAAFRFWDGTFIFVSAAGDFGCAENGERSDQIRRFTDRRALSPASAFVQDGWTLGEGAR
jgi:hypothetical protein